MRLETSAGIAHNKPFAKIASGLNKPSKQTIITKSYYPELLKTTKLKDVPGMGPVMRESVAGLCGMRLDSFEAVFLGDLQRLSLRELETIQGGPWLYNLVRGEDDRPVQDKGPPSTIGFQGAHRFRCRNLQEVYCVILMKAEQCAKRLAEDEEMYQRVCRTLVLSFSFERKTISRSCPMPARGPTRVFDIASAAMAIIASHAKKDPGVVRSHRFGLSASGFSSAGEGLSESNISAFFHSGAGDGDDDDDDAPREDKPKLVDPWEWKPAPHEERHNALKPELPSITKFLSADAPLPISWEIAAAAPKRKPETKVVGGMDRFVVPQATPLFAEPPPMVQPQRQSQQPPRRGPFTQDGKSPFAPIVGPKKRSLLDFVRDANKK